jgi:hypothetical protein
LLVGWAYYKFSGKKRIIAELLLVGCLLLTQSFTAIGFLVLLASAFIGLAAYRKPLRLLWILPILAMLLSIVFVVYDSTLSSAVSLFLEIKQPSINQHVFPWSLWIDQWTKWILIGVTPFEFYESWWNSSLINFGIFWYLVNLAVIGSLVYSVVGVFRAASNRVDRAISMGVLIFSAYMVFGALNLPMFAIFPINFLFFTFTFLVLFKRIRWQAVSTRKWTRRASILTRYSP